MKYLLSLLVITLQKNKQKKAEIRPFSRKKNILATRQDGFTLIEIMVVVTIIGIVIATIILYNFNTKNLQAKQFAKQMYALFTFAQQEAILQPATLGWQVNNNYYEFMRYDLKNNSWQGSWVTLDQDHILHNYQIPNNIDMQFTIQSNPYSSAFQQKNNNETDSTDTTDTGNNNAENDDNKNNNINMIIFFSNGELTPFTMTIGVKDKPPMFQITGNANGIIRMKALGEKQ